MTKKVSSVLVLCLFSSSFILADDKFSYEGYIRAGYQLDDPKDEDSMSDFALGGMLHVESNSYEGVSVGATFFTTNSLFGTHDGGGVAFFSSDAKGYSILGESYLKANISNTTLILGRQILDTPFADSDDIGMVPNSFEAYTIINKDFLNTTLIASLVKKMSGVDANIAQKFTDINSNNGVQTFGLVYEGVENLSLQGWFYNMPNLAKYSYLEATYEGSLYSNSYSIATQYALQNHDDLKSVDLFGFALSFTFKDSGITLLSAYDKSSGGVADNGFGGGPFFVNCEHQTLSEAGEDGEVYMYGLEYDMSEISDGLTLSLVKSELKDKNSLKGEEIDILLGLNIKNNLSFDLIYCNIDNDISGDKFDNTRLFVNYKF